MQGKVSGKPPLPGALTVEGEFLDSKDLKVYGISRRQWLKRRKDLYGFRPSEEVIPYVLCLCVVLLDEFSQSDRLTFSRPSTLSFINQGELRLINGLQLLIISE